MADLQAMVEPDRADRRIYSDPAVFELEKERIFGRAWIYVGHESQLRTAGDFVRASIGNHDVVLARTESGGLSVVHNRCGHRGARVVVDETGNAPYFQCAYHG